MIIENLSEIQIFVKPGITDMRKSIDGLAVIVQNGMQLNPLDKKLFLFTNKKRNLLKVLYWDKNGFWLFYKRLEKHKFPWLKSEEMSRQISEQELRRLLSGVDFFKAHTVLKYSRVG